MKFERDKSVSNKLRYAKIGALICVWGRVFHFSLFSYRTPLKSLYTLKITHIQLWKKSPSRLLLKRGSKLTKNDLFSKKTQNSEKMQFFHVSTVKNGQQA